MSDSKFTRRDFVETTTKAAFGAMIVPRFVLGGRGYRAPSDMMNVAIIGFGGMGSENALALAQTENIVAVCDVDMPYCERAVEGKLKNGQGADRPEGTKLKEQFTKAKKYSDFREMLDKERGIEGVVIATPDHLHAVIARAAMERGKHVYVQKPLTYSVHEARVLRDLARRNPKLVTQMGNQGHSSEGARLINEWVQAGIIGPVREVHVWTNRPIWPQGLPRPLTPDVAALQQGRPANTSWGSRRISDVISEGLTGNYPKPDYLHWDLYLGPVPEDIGYHPVYHPFNWRGWLDFGVGALGDMGAHLVDHPFWALNLGYPTSIEATSSPFGTILVPAPAGTPNPNNQQGPRFVSKPVSYPQAMTVHYEFPARGAQPPVRLSWYDGGLMPPRPAQLPDEITLNREGGVFFIGDKGILMHETYGSNPRIFPDALHQAAQSVPKSMARIPEKHETNWANACKGQGKASSPFEYSAQLTEVMLLGIAALRTGQGAKIVYDGNRGEITNNPSANQYLTREYRKGWEV
jgi:hypothetical protein